MSKINPEVHKQLCRAMQKVGENMSRKSNEITKRIKKELKRLKQESKMQEFKNGQEVEVYEDVKGKYDKLKDGRHYVTVQFGRSVTITVPFKDSEIRPVQLICDEARERLATSGLTTYKINVESIEYMEELCRIGDKGMYLHNSYNCTSEADRIFKEKHLPELNLKTGVVIPCVNTRTNEDLCKACSYTKELENSLSDANKELEEKDDLITYIEEHHAKTLNAQEQVLNQELKEKNVEIEDSLSNMKDAYEQALRELDECKAGYNMKCGDLKRLRDVKNIHENTILELKRERDSKDNSLLILGALIKEKDAEIERLTEHIDFYHNIHKSFGELGKRMYDINTALTQDAKEYMNGE